jgi:hypothetical protein
MTARGVLFSRHNEQEEEWQMIKAINGRMLSAFALGVFIHQTLDASEAVREVLSEAAQAGNQPTPSFYRGYVYFIDDPNGSYLRVYAPDGHLTLTTGIQDKHVQSVAIDNDGTVAVSWQAAGGRAGIDVLDGIGRLTGSVDTGVYVPSHLVYGDDHTLWTFGWQQRTGNAGSPDGPDYMTVRRFSSDRKQLGAWLPRSSFPKGLEPAVPPSQVTRITAAKDRIGVLAQSGVRGSLQEWIEFDLQGNLIGRWRLDDSNFARVALTTDGRVYVQKSNGPSTTRFFTLDRNTSTWKPVTPLTDYRFCGADGDQLVFASWKAGPMHLRWFNQP